VKSFSGKTSLAQSFLNLDNCVVKLCIKTTNLERKGAKPEEWPQIILSLVRGLQADGQSGGMDD
jgi:hypothetical protein